MKSCILENRLAEAEQPVKNFMADLIEELSRKDSTSQDPKLCLRYFGVKLEIKLVSFDGDESH